MLPCPTATGAGNATAARDGEILNEVREEGIGNTSAKYLPGARIVRAFNAISYKVFASEANRTGDRMAIPLAGDDKDALTVVSNLVHDAGFDPAVELDEQLLVDDERAVRLLGGEGHGCIVLGEELVELAEGG